MSRIRSTATRKCTLRNTVVTLLQEKVEKEKTLKKNFEYGIFRVMSSQHKDIA